MAFFSRSSLKRLIVLGSVNALIFSVLALLLVGAMELYFLVKHPPKDTSASPWVEDSELGWDTKPSIESVTGSSSTGPAVYFIGDSFTDQKNWPMFTTAFLKDRGVSIDGYSLGVSGYGTTQELLKLKRHYTEHYPKAVVLLLFAWNDLRDNYRTPS